MKLFYEDQPLWLPPGSVRALIVGSLTLCLAFVMVKYAFTKEDIPPTVEQLMASLLPALVLLIKDYINSRSSSNVQGVNGNGTELKQDAG